MGHVKMVGIKFIGVREMTQQLKTLAALVGNSQALSCPLWAQMYTQAKHPHIK